MTEIYDEAVLAVMAEAMADDDWMIIGEIVQVFLEETPGLVQQLRTSFDSADNEVLSRSAHTIKSSCANVGAMRLSEQCADIENSLRGGDIVPPEAILMAEATWTATEQALRSAVAAKVAA